MEATNRATLNTFKEDIAHHLDTIARKSGAIRILPLVQHMAKDVDFGSQRFIDVWDGREPVVDGDMREWLQKLELETPTYFSVVETSKAMCYQRDSYTYAEAHWLYLISEMLHVLDEQFAFRFGMCKPHHGIYPKQATSLGQSAHFLVGQQYQILIDRLKTL